GASAPPAGKASEPASMASATPIVATMANRLHSHSALDEFRAPSTKFSGRVQRVYDNSPTSPFAILRCASPPILDCASNEEAASRDELPDAVPSPTSVSDPR